MRNNFNSIAIFYDMLSWLVFGSSIKKAQTHFLEEIKSGDSVLILGGGTGWILKELNKLNKHLHVVYVDASTHMIRLARKKKPLSNLEAHFITGSIEQIPDQKFDVIITNFFLDMFHEDQLPVVLNGVCRSLRVGGLWLCTDFVHNASWWQSLLIKVMYVFFRITTNLEGDKLVNFQRHFEVVGFQKQKEKRYFSEMIESAVYAYD